jgi:hypothetical protein
VRVLEREGVGGAYEELGHGTRGQQGIAALGVTEPRQVDRYQVGVIGQP